MRMNADIRQTVVAQLVAYGYALTTDDRIAKGDKVFGVQIVSKGPRLYAKTFPIGAKLWSGSDVGNFVASFWQAKRL